MYLGHSTATIFFCQIHLQGRQVLGRSVIYIPPRGPDYAHHIAAPHPTHIFGQYTTSALFSIVWDWMENGSMYQIIPLLFVKVQKHPENFATFNKIMITNVTISTKNLCNSVSYKYLHFKGVSINHSIFGRANIM